MSNEQTIFLKPSKGMKVHDGRGGYVPAKGKEYVLTKFLRRRIKEGDLMEAKLGVPVKQAKKKAKKKATKKS